MYIVKDDNADVGYEANFVVTDAEDQPIPDAQVNVEIVSDNPDVVLLAPDPVDPKKGTAHFGSPGNAGVTCSVSLLDGTVIASFGSQFLVTVGDPAKIAGGSLKFEGLQEQ